MKKYNIGFICVHNSCRSQMAEAITKIKFSDKFNAFSAGTHVKSSINLDAVHSIKKIYNYDMVLENYHNKLITELPQLDIVITMGCNVECPMLPSTYLEDFGLDDPTGENEFVFDLTAKLIEEKIRVLVVKIESGVIDLEK